MSATIQASRLKQTGPTGLCYVRDVCKQVLRSPTDHISLELLRYTFVGGLASIVDIGVLFVLTRFLGVYYLHSATIAFCCGLSISYILSISWVFHERKFKNKVLELGLFTLIGGIGLVCNGVFIWFFTEYAHLHYLLSKMVSALFVFLWNFLAKKFVLFTGTQELKNDPS